MQFPEGERRDLLVAKLRGFGAMKRAFPGAAHRREYIRELHGMLHEFVQRTALFPELCLGDASEFLYFTLKYDQGFVVSSDAARITEVFEAHLRDHHLRDAFNAARSSVEAHIAVAFELVREWVLGFATTHQDASAAESVDEAAWLVLRGSHTGVINATMSRELDGFAGSHQRISSGKLTLHFLDFMRRMHAHESGIVPLHERFVSLKRTCMDEARARLRLDDFKPRVLTSFVRNRLIDTAYLPLVGDNLAKQIGAAGDAKRTDRMGLLLLVSPPGYGKTTLAEYLASRLGIIFMKINGPAIGHRVTSLDPAETPNAAARDELEKLNLAFEMGDNVMVCLDDIQHLNPSSSKSSSRCATARDASRASIEASRARTISAAKRSSSLWRAIRTPRVAEKFRIPDMLANRADTYNLGDVVGAHAAAFRSSYLENAAASNPTLARIATQQPGDLLKLIEFAENGAREGLDFVGNWSTEEQQEFAGVMKKLLRVRDVVLRVNEEYIRSAAQSDAYRTEPAFKLAGQLSQHEPARRKGFSGDERCGVGGSHRHVLP
jgi:hypothetical protein